MSTPPSSRSRLGPPGPGEPTYRRETRLIHGRMHSRYWQYADHIVPPVSASSAYRLESFQRGATGFARFATPEADREDAAPILIYDRLVEPTRAMLEERLAEAEGGDCCVTFSTGMAAIAAALGVLVEVGDTVLCHRTVYGCTDSLLTRWLPRFGITTRFVDINRAGDLEAALAEDERVRVVFAESPVNPSLELLDLARLARSVARANRRRAADRRVLTVVDNTFATPYCQRPLEHGIDVVVHSLTKNLGGFGTDMGGAVVAPAALEPDLLLFRKDFGGVLSPRAAWPILVHGLPTLPLRLRQQMETAHEVARELERYPQVKRVVYPGLPSHPQHQLARRQMRDFEDRFAPGSLIYLVLAGPPRTALSQGSILVDRLAADALTVTLAVSLGQIRTLIEHPASMTHSTIPVERQPTQGIEPGGVRLSIGIEAASDILADLERAFAVLEPARASA